MEFLHQWAWIEENVGGILPPGTSQIIDELRQQADAAREVIRHLHMWEHVGCVPDSESLPSLECKLLGVRRLKMDLDVSQCRGILVPCMYAEQQEYCHFLAPGQRSQLFSCCDASTSPHRIRGYNCLCLSSSHYATRPIFQAGVWACLGESGCLPPVGLKGGVT